MIRALHLLGLGLLVLTPLAAQPIQDLASLPGFETERTLRAVHFLELDADTFPDAILDISTRSPTWLLARGNSSAERWSKPAAPLPLPPNSGGWIPGDFHPTPGTELALVSQKGVHLLLPGSSPPQLIDAWITETLFVRTKGAQAVRRFGWAWPGAAAGERTRFLIPGLHHDWLVRVGEDGSILGKDAVGPNTDFRRMTRPAGSFGLQARRPQSSRAQLVKGEAPAVVWMTRSGVMTRKPGAQEAITWWRFPAAASPASSPLSRLSPAIVDLDGDALDDLVTVRAEADPKTMSTLRTELFVHRGKGQPQATVDGTLLLSGVISSGPRLIDVDGDGHLDLWLGITQGELSSRLQRLLGRISIEWQLWRGQPGRRPFGRSPAWTTTDRIPTKVYEQWDRRHRQRILEDLTGDGIADRLAHAIDGDLLTVKLHAGQRSDGSLGFQADPAWQTQLRIPNEPLGMRVVHLGPAGPHLELRWPKERRYLPLKP